MRKYNDLLKQIAQQTNKVATARAAEAKAREQAAKSSSPSSAKSKLSEAARKNKESVDAEKKRAELERKAADEQKRGYEALAKADTARQVAQKKTIEQMERKLRDQQSSISRILTPVINVSEDTGLKEFDVFVSHASEDKVDIARPLYESFTTRGLSVWFDEAEIKVGDSLRRKIDEGLSRSNFGIVILSHNFFKKEWPQVELDGLHAKQESEGRKVILPVWHNISKAEVISYSPLLGNLLAAKTSDHTPQEIVEMLIDIIRPD